MISKLWHGEHCRCLYRRTTCQIKYTGPYNAPVAKEHSITGTGGATAGTLLSAALMPGSRPYNQQAGEWTGGGAKAWTLLWVALLSGATAETLLSAALVPGTRPYKQQAGEWTGGGAAVVSVALLSCRAQPLGRGKAHEEEAG